MTASWQTQRLKLHIEQSRSVNTDFPFNDPTLISDIEWSYGTTGRYYSGSLGTITEAQAITCVRGGSTALAEDDDGLLMTFGANAARHVKGRGLWSDTSSSSTVDFNGDLTNAVWAKTNCTIAQDLPTPFAAASSLTSVLGCSITVTADGDATVLQTLSAFTGSNESLPSGRFYLPSTTTLHGTVEITQDGLVWTDVTSQLVTNRWKRIAGAPQLVTPDPQVLGIRLKNALAGDKIGWMLGNVSRGYVMSGDVYTPGTVTVNRLTDVITQNTANFPPMENLSNFTLIVVAVPIKNPLPDALDFVDHPRNGWTVWEMNEPQDIRATSDDSKIEPFGGPGEGSLITVGGTVTGNWAEGLPGNGLRLAAGHGAGARQDITSQVSGTPGGAGTYRCFSDVYPDGQTTPVGIIIEARTKTAQGLALNAAQKPLDGGISRCGMTVSAEPLMTDFGNDPVDPVVENGVNSMVVAFNLAAKKFSIVLNGDITLSSDVQFTQRPVFSSAYIINIGSQYPSGGPLNGYHFRYTLLGRRVSDAEAIAISLANQALYTDVSSDTRITESGSIRITEAGDTRLTSP